MFQLDQTVKQESIKMAKYVSVTTILMVAVFALAGYFDMTVVWGALLGAGWAILNFFLLGLSVQKVTDRTPTAARNGMQLSYGVRLFLTGVVVFVGIQVPVFNWVAVVIPLIFPRIVILCLTFFSHKSKRKEADK